MTHEVIFIDVKVFVEALLHGFDEFGGVEKGVIEVEDYEGIVVFVHNNED